MDTSSKTDSAQVTEIAPERLLNRSARSDFYFSPDPWIASMTSRVENLLQQKIASDIQVMDVIGRHMLFGYAKRLRPIFVLLGHGIFNEEIPDTAIQTAAVCELIHCASLFHDDVIDGARTRKGRQAANRIWGNRSAVIMGDHFFVLAFTMLAEIGDVRLIRIFVETCRMLAEGVMLEIKHTGDIGVTEDTHIDIMTRKTAKFFDTAAVSGAHLADADSAAQKALAGFGLNFGLAFQMSDDLLDLFADPEATGKPRGTDLTAGIYTIPIIHSLETDSDFKNEFSTQLTSDTLSIDVIEKIAESVRANGSLDYSVNRMNSFADRAMASLDKLPQTMASDAFRSLLMKITDRKY